MHVSTNLRFDRRPTQMGVLVAAVRNSRPRKRNPQHALGLRASWHGIQIDAAHHAAFHAACGLAERGGTSILYPMNWMYPLMMRMLSERAAPMPLFFVLNIRMQLTLHAPLPDHGRFNLDLAVLEVRRVSKGVELDIGAQLHDGATLAWECKMTMFYRGRFEGHPVPAARSGEQAMLRIDAQHDWRMPSTGGFRFCRLCGDTNPIHYGKAYAKAFGFERDFAQPLQVIGEALARLPDLQAAGPLRLDARLKGPVYYGQGIKMLVEHRDDGRRFDIYCEPNPKPSICVELTPVPA